MNDRATPAVEFLSLDPVESKALSQAIDRLPGQAQGGGPDPLTPSLRAVLDRFLSVALRGALRSLGHVDGPAALVIDGVAGGHPGAVSPSHHDPTLAMLAWVMEGAGLFPVPRPNRPGTGVPPSDHLLLAIGSSPPAEAGPIELLDPLGRVAALVTLRCGRLVLVDRRRIQVRLDGDDRPRWLESYDLVADPWCNRRAGGTAS